MLNRIEYVVGCYDQPSAEADPALDSLWQESIEIMLVPNPQLSVPQQALIARDYQMTQQGYLALPTRKALVSYLLDAMNVKLDESPYQPQEHPLVILNKEEVRPYIFGQR